MHWPRSWAARVRRVTPRLRRSNPTTCCAISSYHARAAGGCCTSRSERASRRPAAVDVLNGRAVPPRDLLAGEAKDRGDLVALGGTRRPAAQHDGQHALLVQPGALGQLLVVELVGFAEVVDASGGIHFRDSCRT